MRILLTGSWRKAVVVILVVIFVAVLIVQGCDRDPPTPMQPPGGTAAPIINSDNCPDRLDDSPPWLQPAKDCPRFRMGIQGGVCISDWRTCGVTDWVDGFAVEKAHMAREVRRQSYDLASGGLMPPYHYIRFAMLYRDDDGEVQRLGLGAMNCQPPGSGSCSHDELFRRDVEIAVDGDRVAFATIPTDRFPLDDDSTHALSIERTQMQWVLYRNDDPEVEEDWVRWSGRDEERMSADELLQTAPATLRQLRTEQAFHRAPRIVRQALDTSLMRYLEAGRYRISCTRASDLMQKAADGHPELLSIATVHLRDCTTTPVEFAVIEPSRLCREALADCGVHWPDDGHLLKAPRQRRSRHAAGIHRPGLVSEEPDLLVLADNLSLNARVIAEGPIFVPDAHRRHMHRIVSRTAIIAPHLEEPPKNLDPAINPLYIVPASFDAPSEVDDEGDATRFCFIPDEVCDEMEEQRE